ARDRRGLARRLQRHSIRRPPTPTGPTSPATATPRPSKKPSKSSKAPAKASFPPPAEATRTRASFLAHDEFGLRIATLLSLHARERFRTRCRWTLVVAQAAFSTRFRW